jgi:hypothetical protein
VEKGAQQQGHSKQPSKQQQQEEAGGKRKRDADREMDQLAESEGAPPGAKSAGLCLHFPLAAGCRVGGSLPCFWNSFCMHGSGQQLQILCKG